MGFTLNKLTHRDEPFSAGGILREQNYLLLKQLEDIANNGAPIERFATLLDLTAKYTNPIENRLYMITGKGLVTYRADLGYYVLASDDTTAA